MRRPPPPAQQRAPAPSTEPNALTVLSGSEVAGLAESLYLRLFVLALGCLPLICALAVIAALVRTHNADLLRTTALAVALAGLAALALRAPVHAYRALRRRPLLSLGAPLLALTALTIDGITYSPLSYPAAVSIAIPAFVCGRRWALAAATIISVGALTAATLRYGFGVLDAVGQGTAGYFVWALVLAGLAERFAHLAMQLPPVVPPPTSSRATDPGPDAEPRPRPRPQSAIRCSRPLARPRIHSKHRGTRPYCAPHRATATVACPAGRRVARRGHRRPARDHHHHRLQARRASQAADGTQVAQRARGCGRTRRDGAPRRPLTEGLQPGQAARCCIPASQRGAGFLPQRASRA